MAALFNRGEESPGSTEARCRITSGGGDPRDSATENKPPPSSNEEYSVRVKWCGKSAPRCWQQQRQGKPHLEQDQIGTAVRVMPKNAVPRCRSGRSREARSDARPRGMAIHRAV